MRRVRSPAFEIAMRSAQRWAWPAMSRRTRDISRSSSGDTQGADHALPYEWYRLRKTRVCGEGQDRAQSTLVIWIPDESLSRGFLATLTSLSQALVCQESKQKKRMPPERRPAQTRPSESDVATGRHVQDRGAPQFLRSA